MSQLLYTVEEVFSTYLTKDRNEKTFNIPEYQRGYKWSEDQIKQLLDDINQFETHGDEELFYCLQNITLVTNEKSISEFNIVDGQQRTTTLYLILSYLEQIGLVRDKLSYSVRGISNQFIQNLSQDNLDVILKSNDFEEFLISFPEYDFQDIYYMYSCIKTVDNWFEHKKVSKEYFLKKLLKKTKIIVNLVTGKKEEELFMNLNTGKVQLDGADLIRAILITRVSREEMNNFDANQIQDIIKVNEKRVRIGTELDEMNSWWNKPKVKHYFNRINKIKISDKETIRFNYDINPVNLLYALHAKTHRHDFLELKHFESNNKNALELYNEIIRLNRILQDWYNDIEIYHYLGYLAAFNRGFNFYNIWFQWNRETATRVNFIKYLKERVLETAFGKDPGEQINTAAKTGIQYWLTCIKNPNEYWYGKNELERILVLLDCIEIISRKLPFLNPNYFKIFNEDKEHIYPCTPKELKELENIENTAFVINQYIEKLNNQLEEDQKIDLFDDKWDKLDEQSKKKKLEDLEAEINSKTPIHSIGNMVLLNFSINRGFGNDYYLDKRLAVVNNYNNGEYVRQHTLNVFVKNNDGRNDNNDWTLSDIINNANQIAIRLEQFFQVNKIN